MRKLIYQVHLWTGILVAIPFLAWSVSGFIHVLPSATPYGKIETIDRQRVKLNPEEAIKKAHEFAGKTLPTTALTLVMKDGEPIYQAIGGTGMDSIYINAETGKTSMSPPPDFASKFFRQAHFFDFSGSWAVTLMLFFSALASVSALTGIYLNIVYWFGGRGRKKEAKIEIASEQVH